MSPAYNFQVIENCLKCEFREQRLFCNLPPKILGELQKIKATSVYPKGSLLFLEGQEPRGVFILCTGRAKLTTTSAEGKSIILRIAEPGDVLGLPAVVSNSPYEATIETLEPSQANFISQKDFLNFLREYPQIGNNIAKQLTHNCKCAYDEIRSLGFSNSAPEKIAKLILGWAEHPLTFAIRNQKEIPIRVTLTQEEIAQFIGTSRETVSRILGDFKHRGLIRIKGATWIILDKSALERMVTT
jgi:CRP/FNR family transcriptional regulator, cyclic AMP receptor protein